MHELFKESLTLSSKNSVPSITESLFKMDRFDVTMKKYRNMVEQHISEITRFLISFLRKNVYFKTTHAYFSPIYGKCKISLWPCDWNKWQSDYSKTVENVTKRVLKKIVCVWGSVYCTKYYKGYNNETKMFSKYAFVKRSWIWTPENIKF